MSDPIVVSGLGFVSPLGTGTDQVWTAWSAGDSGVRQLTKDDPRLARGVDPVSLPEVGHAGFVRGFEPKAHIASSHLRRMDWCSRMIVACITQAARDANLALESDEDRQRTAIVVGTCFGNQRETQKYMERVLKRGPAAGQPILFPNLVLNAAGGYAAIELGIQGPNVSVSEHEASGEIAIATAVDLLQAGMCDRVIVAGADEFGSVYLGALRERRLLAPESHPGTPRSDAQRGRIVPGEGSAALVLEWRASAEKRGRIPYAALTHARTSAVEAGPYLAPDPERAATRILANLDLEDAPVSAVVGGANGAAPRDELDAVLVTALHSHQREKPGHVRLDALVGDWPSRGAFAAALASLAVARGSLPGHDGPAPPSRVLIPGSARSGALVPVVIDLLPSAR